MTISMKQAGFMGALALWGVGAGYAVYTQVKVGNELLKLGKQEAIMNARTSDSIKNVIRETLPEGAENTLKKLEKNFSRLHHSEKVIKWERALDSLRVEKLGTEVLKEYNQKFAPAAYKAVKDSLKAVK